MTLKAFSIVWFLREDTVIEQIALGFHLKKYPVLVIVSLIPTSLLDLMFMCPTL